MGVKYALSASTADMPTDVEGLEMFRVPKDPAQGFKGIQLRVRWWDGLTDLGTRLINLYEELVIEYGGAPANWAALKALAGNPSDFDDVTNALNVSSWGADILWAHWYGQIGR
jgi:hypothetical protein